jgi:flagellar biosynthetic protein FlhB
MAEESFQEKTEKATPRRREKARETGRVAKSMELNSAIIICLGFSVLFVTGPYMAEQVRFLMHHTMANAPSIAGADPTFVKIFGDTMMKFFLILMPVFAALVVIGIGINVAQVGFKITPKALEPKFERFNIPQGLKQKLSVRTLVMGTRDTIKLFVVAFVAYQVIKAEFDGFFLLPDMSVPQLAITMGKLALGVALKIGVAMLLIAALDYAYQKYEFEKSIKMSKQEVKDEFKDTDGNPQIKARVRQIQREVSRKRMMQNVPAADVVITNPTHLAVALKYDQAEMAAPYVVAKGERLVAERIKEIAAANDIPIFEDRPLARALYKLCDVGQMVPASLYRAVAEVLAYVYRLKGREID